MMKRTLVLAVLMVCLCSYCYSQKAKPSTGSIEQQLMQMERDWSAAYLKHDKTVVERILADDYVGIDGRGLVTNKADELRDVEGPDPKAPPPPFVVLDETVTD